MPVILGIIAFIVVIAVGIVGVYIILPLLGLFIIGFSIIVFIGSCIEGNSKSSRVKPANTVKLPKKEIHIKQGIYKLKNKFAPDFMEVELNEKESKYIEGLRKCIELEALINDTGMSKDDVENLYQKFGLVDSSKNRNAQISVIMCMNDY